MKGLNRLENQKKFLKEILKKSLVFPMVLYQKLRVLWSDKADPISEMALILCYSGWRVDEARHLKVDLDNRFLLAATKQRLESIRQYLSTLSFFPFVSRRMAEYGSLLPMATITYRNKFYENMARLDISGSPKHTPPHDCRHTFSSLCEHYEVVESDRKRMMGHSFGGDITNKVYGHRTLEELRTEIEKIGKDLDG